MSTRLVLLGAVLWAAAAPASTPAEPRPEPLRIGIIGVDTSHAVAFTQILNDPKDPEHIEGARVVHAVRGGSPDIPASADRIDGYARDLHDRLGVEMLESLPDLVSKVDAILVLSVDGRTHLASARAVFGSGKPVFVNKPLAASYADGETMVRLAESTRTPLFSASATRFCEPVRASKSTSGLGKILGAEAYSPATIEPHHPDLFWYAVHSVEMLYSVLGRGCERVQRWHTPDVDLVVGQWKDGRIGTIRGIRGDFHEYGVQVFGTTGVQVGTCPTHPFSYRGLVEQILEFFRTKQAPVSPEETLETLRFMEAAEMSKLRGGEKVELSQVHAATPTPRD